ncbi:hypothetical protein Pcinc_024358 [Petrolisthes cinctipes]|uniref:Uncharacterized protein n=1 Tax=Petrolisthes cinctipes TaxID=88211 RepID=A0AAE1F8K0_PETCI|nr:hypothetical protein Pcinc_025420 [Petrolisthes cinctipes]KAK3870417.1 hypothetical protein Pcinc_024358 [Petrolisthes cinctipes]
MTYLESLDPATLDLVLMEANRSACVLSTEEEEAEFARLLRMEDEYDLEVEIERQLAQEEEEMAEMQENIANQKLALQATKDVNETVKAKFNSSKFFHKPLNKMSSLPSNFTFRGQREVMEPMPKDKASSPVSGLPDIRVENINIPRININGVEGEGSAANLSSFSHEKDLYNPNLKRPSPDEPEDKVSITDLRQKVQNSSTGGARPRSSKADKPQVEKETNRKVKSEAPLAKSCEGEDDISGSESVTPGANSPLLQDQGSPATQRAARRSRWSGSREVSSGGGYKMSLDDSLTQTLMASFDNVPELGGRVDMDSTSCSVCSSEDVSNASCQSSGPSPVATTASGPSTTKDTTFIQSPMPEIPPPPPQVFADDDDDDATLASSSDSFTLEGGPPDVPSLDSSPGSEGMAALSACVSPHSSSSSPVLSSVAKESVDVPVNTSVSSSKSPSSCTYHSETSQQSPTSISAPISVPHSSSFTEMINSAKSFSSLCEYRTGGYGSTLPQSLEKSEKDRQHSLAKYNQALPRKTENIQPSSMRSESSQLYSGRNMNSRQWHLECEGKQVWVSRGERVQHRPTSTIGLQLGDPRPQSRPARFPAGQKCYIHTHNSTRPSRPES